jgi:hypothetical protein
MYQNLTATVVDITDGTYYWRVQAIDPGYAGSPFSTEASFFVNLPPIISTISGQTTDEDTAINSISFTIVDADADACHLSITFQSSNLTLVPLEYISYSCNAGSYTIQVNPSENESGQVTITIIAEDTGSLTSTSSFSLTVTEMNDAPQISGISDQYINGANAVSITFTASDLETSGCGLGLTLTSSNPTLIADSNLTYSCNANIYTLTAQKIANQFIC